MTRRDELLAEFCELLGVAVAGIEPDVHARRLGYDPARWVVVLPAVDEGGPERALYLRNAHLRNPRRLNDWTRACGRSRSARLLTAQDGHRAVVLANLIGGVS